MDRTITFNSVTLKITQRELQKYIIFAKKQLRFRYNKTLELFSTFRKVTVGGFVNQLIKTFSPKYKPLVIYRFSDMALYHSQTRRHVINVVSLTKHVLE